jgi:cytochrome c biogenesis protein CcmG, thiol:disulfide interchange protein DsbE
MRLLSLAAAALLSASVLGAQDVGLPVGGKAPAAAVETLDGKPTDIASYFGRTPVVLEFWASWCENCKALEPQLKAVARKYAGKVRFVAVAVSVNQSPERVRAFARQHPLPVEFVYDRAGKATDVYEAPATSYIVVVDRGGKIVYTGQGSDQDLDAAIRKASP